MRETELIPCGNFNIDLFNIDAHVPGAEFVYRLICLSLSSVIAKSTRVADHLATLIDNIFVDNSLDRMQDFFPAITQITFLFL